MTHFPCYDKYLDLSHVNIMGILNVTPDSFADGGLYNTPAKALKRAQEMQAEGAGIIDIGGESTSPGALPVSLTEELHRVIPVIELLKQHIAIPLSIDTYKPEVMREALKAGIHIVNDIYALRQPGSLDTVKNSNAAIILMHIQNDPTTMQIAPRYDDVIFEVHAFLQNRIQACENAGIAKSRLIADIGFGFGKSLAHNLILLKNHALFRNLGVPLLAGLSDKTMIGDSLGLPRGERRYASLSLANYAVMQGVNIIRTRDVKATKQAVRMTEAILNFTEDKA